MATASKVGVRESPQGVIADGDGVFSRRGSERMVREPSHSEAVSGWRGSHLTVRQQAVSG